MPTFHLLTLANAFLDALNAQPALLAILVVGALVIAGKLAYLAIGQIRFRMVDQVPPSKIVWSNPQVGPYPLRSFSTPAAKGFRPGYVDDRHVFTAARSIRVASQPDPQGPQEAA